MQNLIQWWDQKTGAAVLLLALLLGAGACGIKSQDRSGQTAVVLDLRQAADQSAALPGPLLSNQAAPGTRLVGLLKITAPDLTEPVRFLFPDLQLGSIQTIWVPSGTARTFELLIYEIPPAAVAPDTFPATLLITLTPRELRTLDLAGDAVALELVMGADPSLAQIGTYIEDGYIEMDRNGRVERVPGNCSIVLNATLIDPEFNDLSLGPFPLHIGLDPTFLPGEYLISQVPAGRSFKLELANSYAGWLGESEETLVSSIENPNPINLLLSGFQLLALSPANGLVGDGFIGDTVKFQGSGGYGAYNFSNLLSRGNSAVGSISDTGLYRVDGTYGEDTVDTVTMSDACSPNDRLTAQVYWYMVPLLATGGGAPRPGSPIRSPATPLAIYPPYGDVAGGTYVYLYGQGFDAKTQVFFGDTQISSIPYWTYSEIDLITPPWPTEQYVDVRLFNPRSNALFPDFIGFESIYPGAFSYTSGGGNTFVLPARTGSSDRFKYSPQDEVVRPGNAK